MRLDEAMKHTNFKRKKWTVWATFDAEKQCFVWDDEDYEAVAFHHGDITATDWEVLEEKFIISKRQLHDDIRGVFCDYRWQVFNMGNELDMELAVELLVNSVMDKK